MGSVGLALYVQAVSFVAGELARLVRSGDLAAREVPRLIVSSYVSGGVLLTLGAAKNPISPWLTLTSGASTGFGAMCGLLLVPRIVARRAGGEGSATLRRSRAWILAGAVVSVVFVVGIGR